MKYVIGITLIILLTIGCRKEEQKINNSAQLQSHRQGTPLHNPHTANTTANTNSDNPVTLGHPSTKETPKVKRTVVIPEEVKRKWNSVKLLVADKKKNTSEEKTLQIGDIFTIPESDITVKVGPFLPHMTLGEDVITSVSNEPENPAVNLIITEREKELYNGWAYYKFPDMYNFNHERYSITLIDFYSIK